MIFKSKTARKLVNVTTITHEEWLDYRKIGIGGSDAAAVANVANPKYNSRMKVYQKKTEEFVTVEPPHEYAEMGHYYEPTIREIFKSKNPHLKVYRSNFMWQSLERPHVLANVDGLIYDKEKGWGVLEIKNLSEYRLKEFGEKTFPIEFQIQISHYLYCLGLTWGKFAVAIGGNKYREYDIERNNELIEYLMNLEDNFWMNHVVPQIPPQPDGSEASAKALLQSFTDIKDNKEVLLLPKDVKSLTEAYEFYKSEEDTAKLKKEEAKQQLMAMLGEYQKAEIEGDDKKINWTIQKAFNAVKLREAQPELYKEFVKPTFDAAAFRKAYPTEHKKCMVETKTRKFSITKK